MAIRKTAVCIIVAALWASAAQFPARHKHAVRGCEGVLTIDERGVAYQGSIRGHAWQWKYDDIQELTLGARDFRVLTYKDDWKKFGKDRVYDFTGEFPAAELYPALADRLGQRLIAAVGLAAGPGWTVPVKLQGFAGGSEGALMFGAESVVYAAEPQEDSRTWRYSDIDFISSSGPYQLTITTRERGRTFDFALKQPITSEKYDRLWLDIERKNGRLQ